MASRLLGVLSRLIPSVSASEEDPDKSAYLLKPNVDVNLDPNRTVSDDVNLARSYGWGEAIIWLPYEDAKRKSQQDKKPLMHIVHKPQCLYSKHLRNQFAFSPEVALLSRHFVMVNVNAQDDPQYDSLDPRDLPHIRFYHPDGHFMKDIMCHKGARFKYSYVSFDNLIGSMLKVLKDLESDTWYEEMACIDLC